MEEVTNILNIHPEHLASFFAGMLFAAPFLGWKFCVKVFKRTDLGE